IPASRVGLTRSSGSWGSRELRMSRSREPMTARARLWASASARSWGFPWMRLAVPARSACNGRQRSSLSPRRRLHDQRLHRKVLGQAQAVDERGGGLVAFLHALPELALVDAREGRSVLLALVLEDRADLEPQLLLGQRHQDVRLGDRPFLPGAAVEPHLGRLARIARERLVDRLLAHAMGPVRVREIAGDEHDLGPLLVQEPEDDLDVAIADGVLAHLAGLVEGQVEEPRLLLTEPQGSDRGQRLDLADPLLEQEHVVAVHGPRL